VVNRFSVTRQLRYSRDETMRALDLGLIINGLGEPYRPGDHRGDDKSDQHRLHHDVGAEEHAPRGEIARQRGVDNQIAPIGETPTPGYNNLKAELSYKWRPKRLTADNLSEYTVGIVGNNLLNADIRNSVTYIPQKDEVLMPGASLTVFANVKY